MERYLQDGDLAGLMDAYIAFSHATFQPSLLHSMEALGSASKRKAIADGLEAAIRRMITAKPQPCAKVPLHMVVLGRTWCRTRRAARPYPGLE